MKEYNIKLLVHNDKAEILFDCDKEKNKQCNKKNCSEYCNHTTDSRYMKAKVRQHDNNITDQEIIINLEKEIEYYRNKLQHIQEDTILTNKPKNITKYDEINIYTNGKVVQTIIEYIYKE
ncbi:MAG: hypothetical protein HFJ47_00085 [Clostridia bacterium]|nr:hypothetical protein [Clostridia bacterium]